MMRVDFEVSWKKTAIQMHHLHLLVRGKEKSCLLGFGCLLCRPHLNVTWCAGIYDDSKEQEAMKISQQALQPELAAECLEPR
ncbi:hypothetical protein DD238_000237 [Peronospora effusa]|uniref:Uncharacterized protein n=1 Tax=Peronospora effusa TaxID=542832 RepID=A0A3M6VTE0_9STRA|nr:hypothetical protein DD238_000237 [Peronospora effusa]